MDIQQFLHAPVATIIFVATLAASLYALNNRKFMVDSMLNPYRFLHYKKYDTIITSGFIHADIMHLAFNMFSYFFFAFALEDEMVYRVGPTGHLIFGFIYLASMAVADVSTIYKHRENPSYFSLGASGAVSAVIFSMILFNPQMKLGLMLFPMDIPAPIFGLLYIVYSVVSGRHRQDNINHEAHIGGAFAGWILTMMFFHDAFREFVVKVPGIFRGIF